jgi:hypothetical protein
MFLILHTHGQFWKHFLTPLLVLALLCPPTALLANPLSNRNREEAAIDTITAPQATNDATNVYYQFTYSGVYNFYRVYIDTDQNATTGFATNGIGANFLLENNTLYRYTGTGSNWSWASVKSVTYANASNVARWTVARSDIGEGATPNSADLIFQVEAPLLSSAKVTHVYSGSTTPTRTVTYSPTTALFPNPERGFYRYYDSRSSSPTVWTVAEIQSTAMVDWLTAAEEATITQAYCLFYLDTFLNGNISATYLTHIRTNLTNMRTAGRKCILRFAYSDDYTDSNNNGIPDILENAARKTEPDLPQLLAHIDQLKPILQEYADVIAVLQAGFIGLWGEWYYTDHFVDNPTQPDTISAAQYERRKSVVTRLLDALPANRMIALRYPMLKQKMFGRLTPITAGEAFQNTPLARLGVHNDAFLNSYGDSGTFPTQEPERSAVQAYLQAESLYLTMGGEVNQPEAGAPSRACTNAVNEMALYHWSYINTDYYKPTLRSWKSNGCIHNTSNIAGSILDRLGYRLVLKRGVYPTTARPGGNLTVRIELMNEGFAAPYNPRDLFLVLHNTSTGVIHKAKLPDDPRYWLANGQTHVIARTVTLPTNLVAGTYTLALHLADPNTGLSSRPQYAIRLANANLWRTTSGWNDLSHSVTVSTSARSEDVVEEGVSEGIEFVEAGVLLPSDDPIAVDLPEEATDPTEEEEQVNRSFLPLVTR